MLNNQFKTTDINTDISYCKEHFVFDYLNKQSHEEVFDTYIYSLSFERIIDALDFLFLEMYDFSLGTAELFILKGIWQNKTYSQIALEENYSPDYFTNVAAPKLFKKMSELVGCRVTKKNCRSLLTKYVLKKQATNIYQIQK